jgi:hypothetical protein
MGNLRQGQEQEDQTTFQTPDQKYKDKERRKHDFRACPVRNSLLRAQSFAHFLCETHGRP